jgi:hypothetical protein
MSKSPGSRNEFAKQSKKMNIPLQTVNTDYGKKSKVVIRSVDMVNSKTGEYFGSKTIATKESVSADYHVVVKRGGKSVSVSDPMTKDKASWAAQEYRRAHPSEITRIVPIGSDAVVEAITFTDFLITEGDDDITTLPEKIIKELKGLVRKGASDLQQNWKDALELTQKAYHVANVRKPTPDQKGAWKQYVDLIAFGVQQLSATRGRDGKWRKSDPINFSEALEQRPDSENHIGSHRFFVTIPGEAGVEADAESMDDIIEKMTNKCRRNGAKVRVEERSKFGVKLSIWVNDIKRDTIEIKDIS